MPLAIRLYTEEQVEAVRQFNNRLKAGGATSQFPLSPVPAWLPKIAGRRLYQEYYLAVENGAVVRGASILKHQDFHVRGKGISLADYQLPISEGTVDPQYPQVAVQMLRDAMQKQPLLFGMGMGGYNEPAARLFDAAGWTTFSIPFFFRIVHPATFLENMSLLRKRAAVRCLMDVLAATGLGWLGISALQAVCRPRAASSPAMEVEEVEEFSDWADELWDRCKNRYGMSAVRDAETLRTLYPRQDSRFIRLRMIEQSRTIGWAVLLDTAMTCHNYFGKMRLGSIVDCFADPTDTADVVCAARKHLESRNVDLIVSNQSHAAWGQGFRRAGFWQGPSNYLFTSSPKLTELLRQNGVAKEDMHFNRGDGDGPINL